MVVLFLFATSCSMICNAQKETEKYDWSEVIEAIIQVESKGDSTAVSRDGSSCGILQITRALVKDVNRIQKIRKNDVTYSFKFWIIIILYYVVITFIKTSICCMNKL